MTAHEKQAIVEHLNAARACLTTAVQLLKASGEEELADHLDLADDYCLHTLSDLDSLPPVVMRVK